MDKNDSNVIGELFCLLFWIGIHMPAYALAYLFGGVAERVLGWEGISSRDLLGLYVLLAFAAALVFGVLANIPCFQRMGFVGILFVSYFTPIAPFYLLYILADNSKGILYASLFVLIYFILPLGLSWAITIGILALIGLAIEKLSQFKRKVMMKISPPKTMNSADYKETTVSTNHKEEVKADKPIVWNFADYGKRWVVGQDHAIDTIQKVLIANSKLADLGNPKRQRILASFLFVGPTGVGKTETAKALAGWLEDYGYSSLRIDANQFSDREALWTLLGSPKGYVGSDKPGLLPYAISQNPKQIILIDEIEKADQGFYQFLLQMLDEGYVIERSTGYRYYLQRAIVIITSNLENKRIAEIMETLSDPIQIDIAVRKTLEEAVVWLGGGRSFRITPEFLSRIDAIVPFRSLGFEDLVQIAYRDLRDLGLNVSYETVYELTRKYYPVAKEYGVRYFIKKIQEDVLTQ
jgi:hypothetical protein